jgi:hypothetical protein
LHAQTTISNNLSRFTAQSSRIADKLYYALENATGISFGADSCIIYTKGSVDEVQKYWGRPDSAGIYVSGINLSFRESISSDIALYTFKVFCENKRGTCIPQSRNFLLKYYESSTNNDRDDYAVSFSQKQPPDDTFLHVLYTDPSTNEPAVVSAEKDDDSFIRKNDKYPIDEDTGADSTQTSVSDELDELQNSSPASADAFSPKAAIVESDAAGDRDNNMNSLNQRKPQATMNHAKDRSIGNRRGYGIAKPIYEIAQEEHFADAMQTVPQNNTRNATFFDDTTESSDSFFQ